MAEVQQHTQDFQTKVAKPVDSSPVLFSSQKRLRTYTLNRPAKLNALDFKMFELLRAKVQEWNNDPSVGAIVGQAKGGRAFCAGGDVVGVVMDSQKDSTRPRAVDFCKRQLEMDYIFSTLQKPYVAIMDGITMGGGLGITFPAPFRVATERTSMAMPETKIGFSPDVGATWFLPRLDGEIGTWMALTGETVSGRDCYELGLATHYLPSSAVPAMLASLYELPNPSANEIARILDEHQHRALSNLPPHKPALRGQLRNAVDSAFAQRDVESIISTLTAFEGHNHKMLSKWATKTLATLADRSPTSLRVALEGVRRGKHLTRREALEMELRTTGAYCNGATPDFTNGVMSVIVNKGKSRPSWSPPSLQEVCPRTVATNFFDAQASSFITPDLVLDLMRVEDKPYARRVEVVDAEWELPEQQGAIKEGGSKSRQPKVVPKRWRLQAEGDGNMREHVDITTSWKLQAEGDGNAKDDTSVSRSWRLQAESDGNGLHDVALRLSTAAASAPPSITDVDPMLWGLPSEHSILMLLSQGCTRSEALSEVHRRWGSKAGWMEKVADVEQRREQRWEVEWEQVPARL